MSAWISVARWYGIDHQRGELKLAAGQEAYAVIKASDVMVAID